MKYTFVGVVRYIVIYPVKLEFFPSLFNGLCLKGVLMGVKVITWNAIQLILLLIIKVVVVVKSLSSIGLSY